MRSAADLRPGEREGERRSRRRVLTGLLVLSVLLAVGLSSFASAQPDGLEYVARQLGFEQTATSAATADSPLADYETTGVQDSRLSTGFAGVAGLVTTGAAAFALFWLLRRRRS